MKPGKPARRLRCVVPDRHSRRNPTGLDAQAEHFFESRALMTTLNYCTAVKQSSEILLEYWFLILSGRLPER